MRLFVAVWPSPEAVAAIGALARPPLPGVRWTTPDQWHATLRFLGQVDEDDLGAAVEALHAGVRVAAADGEGPVARMGPTVSRFGQRILHVPVAGLDALAAAVVAATAEIGEPPEDRAFTGHITLARVRPRPRSRVDLRPLCGLALAAEWPVQEVTLVASHPDRAGARYDVIASASV